MKTYIIQTEGQRLTIAPDPKREGLYKVSISFSNDGFNRIWSHLYGKKNQSAIQELIKTAK